MGDVTRISVGGPVPYDVVVGAHLAGEIVPLLGPEPRRVAVVHQPSVSGWVEAIVRPELAAAGLDLHLVEVLDGELAKTLDVAASCWSVLGRAGFTRSDAVVAVGGGAVTDLAGFVAAAWLRGVRVVHLPTTLLGMVDAAIGGKTGLNTAAGKNLVGAVHPPAGVICDLATLGTLPRAELVTGLAEVVKCGFIADPVILDLLEADPAAARDPSRAVLRELVERAIRIKAAVVGADLYEVSADDPGRADGAIGRIALNYGHTLAHAIELVERYTWRHGAAVSVGLVFAAELGRATGHLDEATCARHRAVLRSLELPTRYRPDAWPALRAAMSRDKKARADRLRFVVLDGLARPTVLDNPPEDVLAASYAALG